MSKKATKGFKAVKAKRKCCKDKPRCQACPLVLKRLADADLAVRLDLRRYEVAKKVPKPALAAARTR
ncbi:hypothetical protein ACIB24_13245 [Spongisporangium articulatum]|uniref:Uncharacterized protein n=1 Tax=Spongisporangium articulatum TaxID=3362603 RepID=A0ABW8ANS3_9ACTN